ncbi:MAG: 3-hydroxyacyl-CoA dehydrogenase NAD-binding domain-containing protein [Hyphomicrobiales bacterium]
MYPDAIALSPTVALQRQGSIALLWIDNPPVNAISASVRAGLYAGLQCLKVDESFRVAIIACKGAAFSSGADITEFGNPEAPPLWSDLDREIEFAPKPVIAAIHGRALGGGLEIALACHYRVATIDALLGLPEVQLGLIPGAGGTQRLPRLIGLEAALNHITSGRPMDARTALALGGIDAVIDGDLAGGAISFAERIAESGGGIALRRSRDLAVVTPTAGGDATIRAEIQRVSRRQRGFMAPLRAIEAVRGALTMPFDAGMKREAEIFDECLASDQHRALSYLFFAERAARKVPGLPAQARSIDRVGIVGGGTMGRGIALALVPHGINVTLIEQNADRSQQSLDDLTAELDAALQRGRITNDDHAQRLKHLRGSTELGDLADVDLVIEAVYEDIELKRQVFGRLEVVVGPQTLLATNTSNLNLNEIAEDTSRPERVLGLHFFSPANVMSLLEIVRGRATDIGAIAAAFGLAKRIGKQPVLSGVCDGFIANRIFDPYFREADFLVEEGASPYDVDDALVAFGMPMGPYAVSDLTGLDVGQLIRKRQRALLPAGMRYSTLEDEIVERGRLGQKSGAGWYRYEEGRRSARDETIFALIDDYRARKGFAPRPIQADEIVGRCVTALVNEAAKLLDEGIALRGSDVDVAAVHGYGFPRFLGGPLRYADDRGLRRFAEDISQFHQSLGPWWCPSPLLLRCAAEGRRLSEVTTSGATT